MKTQVLFLLVIYLANAYGLKCYVCQGTNEKDDCVTFGKDSVLATLNCEDVVYDIDGIFPVGFLHPAQSAKYNSYIGAIENSTRSTNSMEYYCIMTGHKTASVRSCVRANTEILTRFCTILSEADLYCNYCQSDLCNSSSGLLPSAVLLVLAAFYHLRKCL